MNISTSRTGKFSAFLSIKGIGVGHVTAAIAAKVGIAFYAVQGNHLIQDVTDRRAFAAVLLVCGWSDHHAAEH